MTTALNPDPDGSPRGDRPEAGVPRWRKAERNRLLAIRGALPLEYRAAVTDRIVQGLEEIIPWEEGTIVSAYWPIRAEPDLRPWLRAAHERGRRIALPVALAVGEPLEFREWHPGGRRDQWNERGHPARNKPDGIFPFGQPQFLERQFLTSILV